MFHTPSLFTLSVLCTVTGSAPFPQEDPLCGCLSSSALGPDGPAGVRGLDPLTCSARCLDGGYPMAALTSDRCYCIGEQQIHGLVFSECLSPASGSRGESGGQSVVSCPVGDGQRTVSLYRTTGSLLHNVSVSASSDRAVHISAARAVYPTNTEITFRAVAETPGLAPEFFWTFGDSTSVRTSARTVTKRYHKPGRFDVVVEMSAGQTSVTSQAFPLTVQRAVRLNRLLHPPSVLQNQTVKLSCRVTVGTDLSFLWSFGDGSSGLGRSAEQHVFHRTGEFTVKVTVSNLVSSASLTSHIFVVDRPCQPPPVKNMGPLKLKIHRHEVVRLGVTYEADVDCDASEGLQYAWMLSDSAGRSVHLPHTDTQQQSLTLQRHVLLCDTYTVTARVQVVGSVVYSNYSVRVQVVPSSPVAVIEGGTNVFISKRSTSVITLNGQKSYDPDFPTNALSYSWTCKPLSSIPDSCFHGDVSTSSPVLAFPVGFLKRNFDQFQFTLTVHSGRRSASSQTFITLSPNTLGKLSVSCRTCDGDQVNWGQSLSISSSCEDCAVSSQHLEYQWSLYLVNASSRPVVEVPFCFAVDLGDPSSVLEGSTDSPLISETSTQSPAPALGASEENLGLIQRSSLLRTSTSTKDRGEKPLHHDLEEFDHSEIHLSSENLLPQHFDQSDVFREFSSAEWQLSSPDVGSGDVASGDVASGEDYEVFFQSAEEGEPGSSAGRPSDVDGESFFIDDSVFESAAHEGEGSDLLVSRPSAAKPQPTLLDLPRDPVDRGLFESYTYTGISSPVLGVRAFALRPGSRYLLEVTATSRDRLVGRTQLFLEAKPVPKGMMCQVQPVRGTELRTHFSIFCTSGNEDLLYEYSFSVGDKPARLLYQGRDFQYYFNLPSGDPADGYRVTIYITIRGSRYGTTTKPCPVTVQVQPSFLRNASESHPDPDLELSESGLRNLSALVKLGNIWEIRNYISLLSGILNRLGLDAESNAHAQRLVRNALICTVCELKSSDQLSLEDNIYALKDLLQVTNQVSFRSIKQVAVHLQAVSDLFLESGASARFDLDHNTLHTLLAVLSYNLQATAMNQDYAHTKLKMDNITHILKSESLTGENMRNTFMSLSSCLPPSSTRHHIGQGEWITLRQRTRVVDDILQTASQLMLKYILLHKLQQHTVSTGHITLHAAHHQPTSAVISGGSTTFYLPDSLLQLLSAHHERGQRRPCVISVLTELKHNPYTCTHCTTQEGDHRVPSGGSHRSGRVVDLSLYKCNTRRKVPVRSLALPVHVEFQHAPGSQSPVHEFVLLRSRINFHSFNISRDDLQRAVQLSVVFLPQPIKAFPIMLLFRMFERPTPSMHHLRRIHHWESNSIRITLPPSYLNAAGVGHLALLNVDFGKPPRQKYLREQVGYSLTVVSRRCLSWDGHRRAWTHEGCETQQVDTTSAVNCSCHQLRPVTVEQNQIQGSFDTTNLDLFQSVPCDLTVLAVLLLTVSLYVPGLVLCKRADAVNEKSQRVHFLSDNSTFDEYLYAVTVHTGLCSAATMSAKVYVALYGEDGASYTKELHVPGCTLFRRNSRDTFILSTAESLGSVWGVHIWHDNSGPSPSWYLKQVEVTELNRGGAGERSWLFRGHRWLCVTKGDGQVERMLRVCNRDTGFAEMLRFKFSDFLADFHLWMSVHSCPCPNLFTHTQRLSVCLLLLSGYACVNAVIISQMDQQLPLELGILDVSVVSVETGLLTTVAVLPGATIISCLFRKQQVKLLWSGVRREKGRKGDGDEDVQSVNDRGARLSLVNLMQWMQETWIKKPQGVDLLSVSTTSLENKDAVSPPDVMITNEDDAAVESSVAFQHLVSGSTQRNDEATQENKLDISSESLSFCGNQKDFMSSLMDRDGIIPQEKCSSRCGYHAVIDKGRRSGAGKQWCCGLAWLFCLLLVLSCLVLAALLGMRFSSGKRLLWIHSLFFSLVFCIFCVQPAVILIAAVFVTLWCRKRADFPLFSINQEFELQLCRFRHQEPHSHLEKLLADRQRTRYLRLVRPPNPAELRRSGERRRRETLIHNIFRDLSVCISMILLMTCVTYSSSNADHYQLNQAVRKQFMRNINGGSDCASIETHQDLWKCTQTSLINVLYKNTSTKTEQSHILIGEPILWKREKHGSLFQEQISSVTIMSESLRSFLSGNRTSTHPYATQTDPVSTTSACGHLTCYSGPHSAVGLGHTKSEAASRLDLLRSGGWLSHQTLALKVQFTLYSPAFNLFTSVTLVTEQSPTAVTFFSSKVQSVRIYHTPAGWDYIVMVCQLLFLLLSVLLLGLQISKVEQQGLMGCWRTPCNWLEAALLTVTLVYHVYSMCHSSVIMDAAEQLQRHRGHVDVSVLASWEEDIRTLRGVLLFLLTLKSVSVLGVNETLTSTAALLTRSLSRLFWPTVSGLILLAALSCAGNLVFGQRSVAFSSVPRSLQTLLCHHRGVRALRGLLISGCDFLYCGILYLSSSVMRTAVVLAVVSSLVRRARRSRRRTDVFTAADIGIYIRRRVSEFFLRREPQWIDDRVESKTYYLEEFESLVDELLFRLNALTDCLHHTLPPKLHRYMEEDSPTTSPVQELSNIHSQHFIRTHSTEEAVRYMLDEEMLRNTPSSDMAVPPNEERNEENPNGRDFQIHLRGQKCLSLPESPSLINIWTEDVLEKREEDRWTKSSDSSWLNKTQATRTEVTVEVLVHEEPGSVRLHKLEGTSG